MWGAISYAEKLNWCTSSATLTLLDTEMRFWHHTCCPQWTSVWKFYSTTTLGAHNSCYCWLSNQPELNSAPPWPIKSLDLNPIEQLWMTWIHACAVVNQRRNICKNCSRLLNKNRENSARPYSSIDRVYAETDPCCVTG
jgi:hypothetical protein